MQSEARTRPTSASWLGRAARSRRLLAALLIAVIATGTVARTMRCQQGLPYKHHQDGRSFAARALNMMKTGDFNPHIFNYGALNYYTTVLVDAAHYIWLCTQQDPDPRDVPLLSMIETPYDTGSVRTFSHPSFLFWNRFQSTVFGMGTLILTWILGREIVGRWTGLLAVLLLAGVHVHLDLSARIAPEMPALFFALLTILHALRFSREGRPPSLYLACGFSGLAAASKYNLGLSVIVPLIALAFAAWRRSPVYRGSLWVAACAIPPLVFILVMPYSVLDFPGFVEGLGKEAFHYNVLGSTGHTVEPRLPMVRRQLELFSQQLGWPVLVLAALGLVKLVRNAPLALVFPAFYFVFMTGTRIDFHYNYLILYPFIAIAFATAVAQVVGYVEMRASPALAATLVVLVAAFGVLRLGRGLHRGYELWTIPDTRTRAITAVNRLAEERGWQRIAIARELRIHESDLARLVVDHVEVPMQGLAGLERPVDAVLTATTYAAAPLFASEANLEEAAKLNGMQPVGEVVLEIVGAPKKPGGMGNPGVRVVVPR